MRIALCEDQRDDAAALHTYIKDYFARMGYAGEVCLFEDGETLLAAFTPAAFDIVFLDIYLPGISGIDVARRIREQDADCRLIFLTMSTDHSMDGFEVLATGYLVKPIDQAKMDRTLYMCRDLFLQSARTIELTLGRERTVALPLPKIRYIEVNNKAVKFHMDSSVFEARLTLDEVEAMLGGLPFLRCHRSYIVNLNHVTEIRADDFVMRGGDLVPMRANGKREVRLAYAKFMAERAAERRHIE